MRKTKPKAEDAEIPLGHIPALNVEYIELPWGSLLHHPKNTNEGDTGAIALSISELGVYRPLIVQRSTRFILAGNHTYDGIGLLTRNDDLHMVMCALVDCDDNTALNIMLADNNVARQASENVAKLAELLQGVSEARGTLRGTSYTAQDLDALLTVLVSPEPANHKGVSEPPSPSEAERIARDWDVRVGDVWKAGKHTITCGDYRDAPIFGGDVPFDAIHGDPPYGINIVDATARFAKLGYRKVLNDDRDFNPAQLLSLNKPMVLWGANHYANRLPNSDRWLCWDKQGGAKEIDFANIELAWCSERGPARMLTHVWDGFRRDSERGEKRVHPTQKPVEVCRWAMGFLPGESIMVPCCGSGSELLAIELLEKVGFAWELDPVYVACTLHRLQLMGLPVERIYRVRGAKRVEG